MGGEGYPYRLSGEEKRLAVRAARVMGTDICGVDLMPGPKGPVIIETNVNAQFKGIETATKRNIAKTILKSLTG